MIVEWSYTNFPTSCSVESFGWFSESTEQSGRRSSYGQVAKKDVSKNMSLNENIAAGLDTRGLIGTLRT